MKLFFYYAFHSVKNQLKKLFKTWVLIFLLACLLFGVVIGVGAGFLADLTEDPDADLEEDMEEVLPENEDKPLFVTSVEDPASELVELIAGGIVLLLLFFEAIGADKNGSKIFLPADVNILFPSPMKPQSVLLFRLLTQIGVILLSSLYLLFQVPSIVMELGLDIWAAIGIIAAWLAAVAVGKLLQIFLYTVTSTHKKLKKHLRTGIYAAVLLLAGAFYLYAQSYENDYFAAAVGFFNKDFTRWIPFWGWLKGLCMYSVEGNLAGALLSLGLLLVGGGVLAAVIWKIKADFYEDALVKTQETAELQEVAQSDGGSAFVKRKKDRSEKLKRDGMKHGSGANVFFFRSMYNRFRFAHFGVFTKTSETYLVVAVGIAALCRFVLHTDSLLPIVLTLSGFAFFRTLGNPLEEDTSKDFFRLIPERTLSKLFWSVLAGSANCLLDLIPALLVATLIGGSNPLLALAWIPFIISIDFYGTNVGAFINLSAPISAGKPLKQMVQILFIYFGLLPDIVILIVGWLLNLPALAAVLCAAFNFGLGALFLLLTPLFIDHAETPARQIQK